jgi:hypothetical protein
MGLPRIPYAGSQVYENNYYRKPPETARFPTPRNRRAAAILVLLAYLTGCDSGEIVELDSLPLRRTLTIAFEPHCEDACLSVSVNRPLGSEPPRATRCGPEPKHPVIS